MAPPLAATAETTPSLRPLSPLMTALESVAPIILLILLLLLCFPFKRNKQQFSTKTPKQDINPSELIRMTKLEDGPRPEETSLSGGKLHQGGLLHNHQVDGQTNAVAAADLQLENLDSQKDTSTIGPNHPSPEKPKMASSDHLGSFGPQAACPNTTTPGLLQLRKLPMTPKEAHLSRAEPMSLSMDSQVYESIRDVDRELCVRDWSEKPDLPASATTSVDSGEKIPETLEQSSSRPAQLAVALQHSEPSQQLLDGTPAEETPIQPMSDAEKRLSAMYARVCKKPKAAQPLQPADNDRPASQEEEEPPPIPEKQFEDLYESLNISTEMQGVSVPSVTTPSDVWTGAGKRQTSNQPAVPQTC